MPTYAMDESQIRNAEPSMPDTDTAFTGYSGKDEMIKIEHRSVASGKRG